MLFYFCISTLNKKNNSLFDDYNKKSDNFALLTNLLNRTVNFIIFN